MRFALCPAALRGSHTGQEDLLVVMWQYLPHLLHAVIHSLSLGREDMVVPVRGFLDADALPRYPKCSAANSFRVT